MKLRTMEFKDIYTVICQKFSETPNFRYIFHISKTGEIHSSMLKKDSKDRGD